MCLKRVSSVTHSNSMESSVKQLVQGKALLFIIVVGLGGSFQVGCHLTLISSPYPFINSFMNSSWTQQYGQAPEEDMLTLLWATFVAFYSIGAIFGSICVQFFLNHLGRKKAMMCNSMINIFAVAIMMTSRAANSFEMIILARFLFGVTSGLAKNIHSIYLGESSPKNIRGAVSVTMSTFNGFGKLVGQIAGLSELLGRDDLWHILLCVPAFFGFVQIFVLPFFPEAPGYLLIEKGKQEECKKALQFLWGPGDYKLEIEEMQQEQEALKGQRNKSLLELLTDSTIRWQCLSLVVLYGCIQFSGIRGISSFSYSIFQEAGIPVDKIRYVTLGVGVLEILTSITCSMMIERFGRRVLLWGGFGIMAVLLVLLTISLQLKDYYFWVPYCSTGLVFLFVISFVGGPGGVAVPLCYEMFVQSDRSAAFLLLGLLFWGGTAIISFIFPFLHVHLRMMLTDALKSFSFLLFACSCLTGSLYIIFVLPETKGKTPLEIAEDFRKIRLCGSANEDECLETKL